MAKRSLCAEPLEPGRAVVPHFQRPEDGRIEDHDAAVLPARMATHPTPRRRRGHRVAVVELAPEGRGGGRLGLPLALRPVPAQEFKKFDRVNPGWSPSFASFPPPAAPLPRSSRRSSETSSITRSRLPRSRLRSTRPNSSRSGPSWTPTRKRRKRLRRPSRKSPGHQGRFLPRRGLQHRQRLHAPAPGREGQLTAAIAARGFAPARPLAAGFYCAEQSSRHRAPYLPIMPTTDTVIAKPLCSRLAYAPGKSYNRGYWASRKGE